MISAKYQNKKYDASDVSDASEVPFNDRLNNRQIPLHISLRMF
jgi:hypothetical protein